jgi:hypothetical protein
MTNDGVMFYAEQDAMLRKVLSWVGQSPGEVHYQSTCRNIYHCTVQKSASQWIRAILADPRTFQYCGLTTHSAGERFQGRYLQRRESGAVFSSGTIITPLYVHHDEFVRIPKPAPYRAFFVMRDPRDVVTSWYFSLKHSHPATAEVEPVRRELNRLSEADGFLYAIDFLRDYGLFAAQRSWAGAADNNVMLVRFEDLISHDQVNVMQRLLTHCDIAMPPEVLTEVLKSHSFETRSGRKRGEEDPTAHYRKGVVGDWRNHFDERIHARCMEAAGDVMKLWGYDAK